MTISSRFIGLRPYRRTEIELFFGRDKFAEKLVNTVKNNFIVTLHSKAGAGKTSLLNTLISKEFELQDYIVIKISFPNFYKNSTYPPTEYCKKILDKRLPETSYLDKIIAPHNSLWYKSKRIADIDKKILLILDQFENIFSFSEANIEEFKNQLLAVIENRIPADLRNEINKKLSAKNQILTEQGKKAMFGTLPLKIIVSVRSDKLSKLDYFNEIKGFSDTMVKLPFFDIPTAKLVLNSIAGYVPKYHIDDNFETQPFTIEDDLLNKIIDFLSDNGNKLIEPFQLQIIGKEIEKIAAQNLENKIGTKHISDIKGLFDDYYQAVINKIEDPTQRVSARKFIEDELIFEYEKRKLTVYQGVATQKYHLTQQTIDLLLKNDIITKIKDQNNDIFYELSHDALITPVLIAKEKRIAYEIRIEEELRKKEELERFAEEQRKKSRQNRLIAISLATVLIIVTSLLIFAIHQKNKAKQNAATAQSTLYASAALNILNTDPTVAFRLAQKAYEIQPSNVPAFSALLKSFYKTGIFYEKNINTGLNFDQARFSPNGNYIAFLSNSPNNKSVTITDALGQIIRVIPLKHTVSEIEFSKNEDKIAIGSFKGNYTLYSIKNGKIDQQNFDNAISDISFSPDNKWIAIALDNNKIIIKSLLTPETKIITTNSDGILSIDFSPDSKNIAVSGIDNIISIYNLNGQKLQSYKYLLEFEFQATDIQPIKFTPDGKNIVFAVNDPWHFVNNIEVLDLKQNKITVKFTNLGDNIVNINILDSVNVLVATRNGKALIINILNHSKKIFAGNQTAVLDFVYSKETARFETISEDGKIITWKIFDYNRKFNNYTNLNFIKYSKTGKYTALGAKSGKIYITALTGDTIFSVKANDVFFSSDDKNLVFTKKPDIILFYNITGINSGKYKFVDTITGIKFDNKILVATNSKIFKFSPIGQALDQLKFTHNSQTFLGDKGAFFIDKNKLFYFDYQTKKFKEIELPQIKKMLFSDDKYLFVLEDKCILTDQKFNVLAYFETGTKIRTATISKKLVAIADKNGKLFIFNLSGTKLLDYQIGVAIDNLQFSSNEKSLLVAYKDRFFAHRFKLLIVSPDEIIKYIDDLKLFGQVYKPDNLKKYLLQ